MPFQIVRNDIVNMQVDAIVNTANPRPVVGYGTDAGVHQKAGPKLLEARKKIGTIPVGSAAITPGFDLGAKYMIHAVGPVWQGGGQGEARLLYSCYEKALLLAKRHRCRSIAFPLISAGNHGFPKDIALQTAIRAISDFLLRNEMQVYLVVFSRDAFLLSEKLFRGVESFINENYVRETNLKQYGVSDKCSLRDAQQEMVLREQLRRRQAEETAILEDCARYEALPPSPAPMAASRPAPAKKQAKKSFSLPFPKAKPTLAELLAQTDATFSETLLKLIDRSGKKDSEVYKRANLSKQHFSKIRNNPDYKPTKATAIALALALELDLEQTKDLIGRAGYALSNSSKFDLIIRYFIEQGNFNVVEINIALYEFDQPLLGA